VFKLVLPIVTLLLLACQPVTVQRHVEGPMPVSVRVDDAAYWLEEWHRAVALPDDQLQQALASREQEFEQDPDSRTRLRLAILLAQGPALVRDQPRALELLQGIDERRASKSAQALAALLEQVIAEQRWAADRISELKSKLDQSGTRVVELEQQLQELTNIEQSIKQRETPADRKEN